jgi:hypothetical protein
MKKIIYILLLVPILLVAQRKSSRYISPFEVKSSMSPVYRFATRTIKYTLSDLDVPLCKNKINLALDNTKQNASFDMVSELYGRCYALNASYSIGAGYFDQHIFIKLIKLKNGDFSQLLKNTYANHSFQAGVNYLGIRQLFQKVEKNDFQFNAAVNAEFAVDFSDRFDMSEYINLFEYQNLPEFVIRNKKSFVQVQDFILAKYSLPSSPLYKGVCIKADFTYRHFSLSTQYHLLRNALNSKVNSFSIGVKMSL